MKSKIAILIIIPMLILGGGNKLNKEYKDRVHKIEMQKEAEIRRKKIQEEKKKEKKRLENRKKEEKSKAKAEKKRQKEEEKKKAELEKQQQKEQEKKEKKKKEKQQKKGVNKTKGRKIKCRLTFYTSLACENGGYGNVTASGKRLYDGCVANNALPFGTKVVIDGKTYTVEDRGCSAFNNIYSYDVYVPRRSGESDSAYINRVNNMGKRYVTAYIID